MKITMRRDYPRLSDLGGGDHVPLQYPGRRRPDRTGVPRAVRREIEAAVSAEPALAPLWALFARAAATVSIQAVDVEDVWQDLVLRHLEGAPLPSMRRIRERLIDAREWEA